MKIKKTGEAELSGIKRFYSGYTIYDTCPECKQVVEAGETANYFSYPRVNDTETISFSCEHLDIADWSPIAGFEDTPTSEWEGEVQISVKVKLV